MGQKFVEICLESLWRLLGRMGKVLPSSLMGQLSNWLVRLLGIVGNVGWKSNKSITHRLGNIGLRMSWEQWNRLGSPLIGILGLLIPRWLLGLGLGVRSIPCWVLVRPWRLGRRRLGILLSCGIRIGIRIGIPSFLLRIGHFPTCS